MPTSPAPDGDNDIVHPGLERQRTLQQAALTATRALLSPLVADPERVLTAVLGALADAIEVEAVALLEFERDEAGTAARPVGHVIARAVWSRALDGARLVDHPIPQDSLPDLGELATNHRVVRLRLDQIPADVAARVDERAAHDLDVIGVPLLGSATDENRDRAYDEHEPDEHDEHEPDQHDEREPDAHEPDEVVAVLAVLAPRGREWTGAEMRFVESVAGAAWGHLTRHHHDVVARRERRDSELLISFGQMIVEASLDPEIVTTILERLATHIGADALVAFERRGDRARPFAHWADGTEPAAEVMTLTAEQWSNMATGAPTTGPDPTWTLYPAVQDTNAIGFLAVIDARGGDTRAHRALIQASVDVLRHLRVRTLTEWYRQRRRALDDLRTRVATAYVEAEHWEVVETTERALAAIGEILHADQVLWVACGDGAVTTERVWNRGDEAPVPDLGADALARLVRAEAPYLIEWENGHAGHQSPDSETDGEGLQVLVVPAVKRDLVEGAVMVSVSGETHLSSTDRAVLTEIARLVQEMEQWAAVEAESDVRRRRLHFQATHDDLTGLGNRRLLLETLDAAIGEGPVAVLMIDMDRFKVVNDSLGHIAGDAVLVAVADRLRLSVREPDLTCRFGGDEFAVMVPGAADPTGLAAMAQRLIDLVREPVNARGTTVIPTCSIGIAHNAPDDDLESLLRHADAALYEAKNRGRDRYAFFDDDHRDSLRDRLELETSLRQGLRSHQFMPWFQPEIDLISREVIGVEALIRWDHPTAGILPASAFIDVAEDVGLAPEMSLIALEGSCRAHLAWRRTGFDTRIRVNVAAGQLQTGDLDVIIAAALERYDMPPDRLCVEITERSLMLDPDSSASALRRLRHLGIEVAIDDFGTGFSSLARLRDLPVDTLKVDRSFVSGLVTSRTDRDIVRTVIGLARAIGLDVVAEGVEQEAQAQILTDLGCRRAQGWLWAGALPAEEIPTLNPSPV